MRAEDYISIFGALFVFQLPTIAIASVGVWFAVARKARLGGAAEWAVWGFSSLILYSLTMVVLRVVLYGIRSNQLVQSGPEAAMSAARLNIWSLAAYPLFLLGLALLARAVFLGRDR